MPGPSYRGLRIILGIFSLLTAVGGLVIIFSNKPVIMRLFLRPPQSEVSTLLLIMAKEMGGTGVWAVHDILTLPTSGHSILPER